jgi:hypothetical protein
MDKPRDTLVTRNWVVAYVTPSGLLGVAHMRLTAPHGLLTTNALWDSANAFVKKEAKSDHAIPLALTPFEEL